MIFISGVIRRILQNNTLCTNKIPRINFALLPELRQFFARKCSFPPRAPPVRASMMTARSCLFCNHTVDCN